LELLDQENANHWEIEQWTAQKSYNC
jgi:hypothetical protein